MTQGNETKYSSFDEWFEKNGELYREPTSDERYLFEAGAASRQDEVSKLQIEIDELQKRVKELELINFDSELHFDAAREHIDCLQKKIDMALEKCYTGIRKQGGDYYLEVVVDILKGEPR